MSVKNCLRVVSMWQLPITRNLQKIISKPKISS